MLSVSSLLGGEMELEAPRVLLNGMSSCSVLAVERGISLIKYTSISERTKHGVVITSQSENCGFANLGNTCFMNSVLQCLRHTRPLSEFCRTCEIDNDAIDNWYLKGSLFSAYVKLTKIASKSSQPILPLEFRNHVTASSFRFSDQSPHDAHEFLMFLLERMLSDLKSSSTSKPLILTSFYGNRSKTSELWSIFHKEPQAEIMDIFVGHLRSTLKCTKCKKESHTLERFFDLSLPTPDKEECDTTLTACIFNFTYDEILDGENKPTCDHCKSKQTFLKRYKIEKFPQILILHLKRFNDKSKQKTLVRFPLVKLDLTKFSARPGAAATYNLFAVTNHSGSIEGGHYTAFARSLHTTGTGTWHLYNDSRVTRVEEHHVITPDAYILFYERVQGIISQRL